MNHLGYLLNIEHSYKKGKELLSLGEELRFSNQTGLGSNPSLIAHISLLIN